MHIRYIEHSVPATPEAVEQAEAQLGFVLPDQYRRYLLTQANGGWIDDALLPGFPHVAVNHILGVGRKDSYDLVRSCGHLAPLLGLGFLPVADSACGNPICVSLRPEDAGTVWFNDHELHYDEPGAFVKLANSWNDFISATEPDESPRETPAGTAESPQETPAGTGKGWVSPEMLQILRNQFAD